MKTEWNHKNTFTVASGEATFVECTVTPGLLAARILPNPVDGATGEAKIQKLKMAGK